jgi:NAD+ synthase
MTQNTLKIALAQLNPIVGDVAGNEEKARAARADPARPGSGPTS